MRNEKFQGTRVCVSKRQVENPCFAPKDQNAHSPCDTDKFDDLLCPLCRRRRLKSLAGF